MTNNRDSISALIGDHPFVSVASGGQKSPPGSALVKLADSISAVLTPTAPGNDPLSIINRTGECFCLLNNLQSIQSNDIFIMFVVV